MRNGGDVFLSTVFEKLVKSGSTEEVTSLNVQLSKYLKKLGVKVVFSFDEAQTLLDVIEKKEDISLFQAFYQSIRLYNNPVFLGTTFSISKVVMNVSKEGRQLLYPIIGSLEPWFLPDVDKMLSQMFDVQSVKLENAPEFNMICYLLSGSPENVTHFHRSILERSKMSSYKDKICLLRMGLQDVIEFKEKSSLTRITQFIEDTSFMNRLDHLFKLLFGKKCQLQNPTIEQLEKELYGISYSQAFIEKTIAFVVKKNDCNVFEIVDPINAKSYFKKVISDCKEQLWEFMAKLRGSGDDFEMFVVVLLIQERERMKGRSISKSPLFGENSSLEGWTINASTFVHDQHLSKKLLTENNIPGAWFGQLVNPLAYHYFTDTFVKPDNNKGPDGMFYLKDSSGNFKLVTCSITLNDEKQPNKAINMLKTLLVSNIGTDKSGKLNNLNLQVPFSMDYLGWIVAPNMDASAFETLKNDYPNLNTIITGKREISNCIEKYKSQPYYENMQRVWKKFTKKIKQKP